MDAAALLRAQMRYAHAMIELTMRDVTNEQARWQPPGVANPIGATYHHVIFGEDMMLNEGCRRAPLLSATEFAGWAGLSEGPPKPAECDWDAWARSVEVDLDVLRRYASAIHEQTDEFLASLDGAALEQAVNLSSDGLGVRPLAFQLGRMLTHVLSHWGEIACLKGSQGIKGFV